MSELSELRADAIARDGFCRWPNCANPTENLEMAHIEPRGMGGRAGVNVIDNVVMLCRYHHSLFDGRSHYGLKRAMIDLLAAYLKAQPW